MLNGQNCEACIKHEASHVKGSCTAQSLKPFTYVRWIVNWQDEIVLGS